MQEVGGGGSARVTWHVARWLWWWCLGMLGVVLVVVIVVVVMAVVPG